MDSFRLGLFDGMRALVTGGGKGIGRGIALSFAALGADVVVVGRTPQPLESVVEEITALGRRGLAIPTDIRSCEEVDALRDRVVDQMGGVDFVINNAGGQFLATPMRITDRGWRAVVDLNLNGTWNVISRFMPMLVEREMGSIVNIVHANVGERGAPMFAHSGAARAGVVNLTRSLAPYLALRGVRVNALALGGVPTDEARANYGFSEEEARVFLGRAPEGDVDDAAAVVVFLCSPAGRFLNGSLVVADGGGMQFDQPAASMMLDAFE